MALENLTYKPLIEAIFEIRWETDQSLESISAPNTQLILGRLFDKLNSTYPQYEQLPSADIPEHMAAGIVKYRFSSENKWPLVQIGTGVLTVNDTENYLWTEFRDRVIDVVTQLYNVHPNKEQLKITSLSLKYIDAVDIDYEDDIYSFLQKKMQLNLSLNNLLFQDTPINRKPIQLDLSLAFNCDKPKGFINFRLLKGQKTDDTEIISDAIIWEITIQSNEDNISDIPSQLGQWLEEAHSVSHNWFFTLVEGDLLRSFE